MAENWQDVDAVLSEALALPHNDRPAWLARRCQSRPELRKEVEKLLAQEDFLPGFLDPGTRLRLDEVEKAEQPSLVGRLLGAYRVTGEIATGGMGVVYRGERADHQFTQRVAIKVARAGLASDDWSHRLQAEQRILASLEHPHIARLFDAGVTAGGLSYFVMEYVDGQPLTDYCAAKALPLRARIHLFCQVCDVVQYAHQNLVVHRDLKPANILVTGDGTVKLLDFGIAKLLQSEVPGDDAARAKAFTPGYSSPEQLQGGTITTASDVYSLGVVLHELLTGERPANGILRNIDADLDCILAKALQRDAAARYPSPSDFASDLNRYLGMYPVEARAASPGYRTGKFLRRNWPRLAFATVAAALILGSILAAWRASVRTREERERSQRLAEHAQAMEERARLEASLAAGQRRVAAEQRRLAEEQKLRAREQAQAAQAERQRRISEVDKLTSILLYDAQDGLAALPGSLDLRRRLVETSLRYFDSLAQETRDTEVWFHLSAAYRRLGELQFNGGASHEGNLPGAIQAWEKQCNLLEQILRHRPAYDPAQRHLIEGLLALAAAQRNSPKGLAAAERALSLAAQRSARLATDSEAQRIRVQALVERAAIRRRLEITTDNSEVLAAKNEQVRVAEELVRANPGDRNHLYALAFALRNVVPGDPDLRRKTERAIEIDRALLRNEPGNVELRLNLSFDLSSLASLHAVARNWQFALPLIEEVTAIRRELHAQDPRNAAIRARLAFALYQCGQYRVLAGRPAPEVLAGLHELRRVIEPLPQEAVDPRLLEGVTWILGRTVGPDHSAGDFACWWLRRGLLRMPKGQSLPAGLQQSLQSCPTP